jgi:hypothetical protein
MDCLLQVVAVSVFLALAFAFYVFFAPFVGRKVFQDAAVGLYTPLVISFLAAPSPCCHGESVTF